MRPTNDQRGGLIIEVLLSIMFVMVMAAALTTLSRANAQVIESSQLKTQAVSLARESMEQMYAVKRGGWSGIARPDGTYRVAVTGPGYELLPAATGEVIDGMFTRTITLSVGQRDPAGRLAAVGTDDANVRWMSVRVSWIDRDQPHEVNLSGYVTNWKEALP